MLEPAGALAVAGMVKYIRENKVEGCTYVAISSGANMDFDRSVDAVIYYQNCWCSLRSRVLTPAIAVRRSTKGLAN